MDSGFEPLSDPQYQRGQITWERREDGVIVGHARILVPKGLYPKVVYAHHPTTALVYSTQHLAHAFDFRVDGFVDLEEITQQDFSPIGIP